MLPPPHDFSKTQQTPKLLAQVPLVLPLLIMHKHSVVRFLVLPFISTLSTSVAGSIPPSRGGQTHRVGELDNEVSEADNNEILT